MAYLRPTAIRVTPLENYRLLIEFDTKEIKMLDIKPFIKGIFYEPLLNEDYFKMVHCDGYTIVWPNEQDICPDNVYSESVSYDGEFLVDKSTLRCDELGRIKQAELQAYSDLYKSNEK